MTHITNLFRQHYLNLLCLLISAILIYSSSSYWFSYKNLSKATVENKAKPTLKTAPHKNSLTTYPLFGEHLKNAMDGKNIPNTLLNLTLIGILKASKPEESQAFIKVGETEEQLYLINDPLSEDTQLIRILDNAVLLKRNGKIERLSLPKEELDMTDTKID